MEPSWRPPGSLGSSPTMKEANRISRELLDRGGGGARRCCRQNLHRDGMHADRRASRRAATHAENTHGTPHSVMPHGPARTIGPASTTYTTSTMEAHTTPPAEAVKQRCVGLHPQVVKHQPLQSPGPHHTLCRLPVERRLCLTPGCLTGAWGAVLGCPAGGCGGGGGGLRGGLVAVGVGGGGNVLCGW